MRIKFWLSLSVYLVLLFLLVHQPVYSLPLTVDKNFKIQTVFKGNFKPSTMAFLGNDLLILDRDFGRVYRVIDGKVSEEPMIDVNVATVGYRGMLGIAVSNGTDAHPIIFLYYTEARTMDGEDDNLKNSIRPLGNRVYRYDLINNKLVNPKLLLDLPAMPGPRHMGGIMAMGPDNNLYISVGDLDGTFRGGNYDTMAQNYLNSTFVDGRSGILRIDQNGSPVGKGILGNLFPLNLYYAYGIRNSFGFDWDPVTGKMWDSENGPQYGDEINLIQPGFNSGWVKVQGIWEPNFEQMGKIIHNPTKLVSFNGKGIYSEPEFTWIPTVAPTAIVFFTSNNYGTEYKNTLFVGDANTGTIYHFKLNADRSGLQLDGKLKDKIVNTMDETKNVTFATGFGRITDMDLGPDGNLYVLSSENGLTVHKIFPG